MTLKFNNQTVDSISPYLQFKKEYIIEVAGEEALVKWNILDPSCKTLATPPSSSSPITSTRKYNWTSALNTKRYPTNYFLNFKLLKNSFTIWYKVATSRHGIILSDSDGLNKFLTPGYLSNYKKKYRDY